MALATLLPVLGCGEQAAALAFSALADNRCLGPVQRDQLGEIARDEVIHDAMIDDLRRALPVVPHAPQQSAAIRRFHIGLCAGAVELHFARIAALDAGLCTIFSRLLWRRGPMEAEARVSAAFRKIRRDEARHVAITRTIALDRAPGTRLRDAAAAARRGVAELVCDHGAAFECLGVDAQLLARDLARLPDGLLV